MAETQSLGGEPTLPLKRKPEPPISEPDPETVARGEAHHPNKCPKIQPLASSGDYNGEDNHNSADGKDPEAEQALEPCSGVDSVFAEEKKADVEVEVVKNGGGEGEKKVAENKEEEEEEKENGEEEEPVVVVDRKGKGILIEDEEEEDAEDFDHFDTSDDSADDDDDSDDDSSDDDDRGSDYDGGEGESELEDDPLNEVDLDNILPSRTRRKSVHPGVYIANDHVNDDSDDSDA